MSQPLHVWQKVRKVREGDGWREGGSEDVSTPYAQSTDSVCVRVEMASLTSSATCPGCPKHRAAAGHDGLPAVSAPTTAPRALSATMRGASWGGGGREQQATTMTPPRALGAYVCTGITYIVKNAHFVS